MLNRVSLTRQYRCTSQESATLILLLVNTPRPLSISHVLKGIRKSQATIQLHTERHPITFTIMKRLHTVPTKHSGSLNSKTIWAACCIAYFGLFHANEFTSPNHSNITNTLQLADVALDSHKSPKII